MIGGELNTHAVVETLLLRGVIHNISRKGGLISLCIVRRGGSLLRSTVNSRPAALYKTNINDSQIRHPNSNNVTASV